MRLTNANDIHETDQKIADIHAASQSWVQEIREELVEDGQITGTGFLTAEAKRELVSEHIKENPDDSNYAIGKELGVSKNTVGSVRKEMESEPSPEFPETNEEPIESDPEPSPEVP